MGVFDRIHQVTACKTGPTAGDVIAKAAAIDRQVGSRQTNELIGICRGILADGALVDAEINFLANWLERNIECSDQWPHNVLYGRIATALADGKITEQEELELLSVLHSVTGDIIEPPDPRERPTNTTDGLPYDDPAPEIIFPDRAFCLTGDFAYGTRDQVIHAIQERQGRTCGAPSGKTHYLIVGVTASTAWKHSTHGTKILRALELRAAGKPIVIVSEKHWSDHLW